MTVSEVLKAWRETEKITQAEAARRAGVSQPTWCDWESGKKLPRLDKIVDLVTLTGEEKLIPACAEELRARGAA
ncbi:MAG TPA: helix-turn-helix transcriptional regulator [Gammaproteobacteria bacterium]|nr:helix-turn-helix transcriptional regulator [Gammaproteobacteria bacterium]